MTRQEKIWKGMEHILKIKEMKKATRDAILEQQFRYLKSEGMVLKVKREIPPRTWFDDWGGESGKAGYELAVKDREGYCAFEELI